MNRSAKGFQIKLRYTYYLYHIKEKDVFLLGLLRLGFLSFLSFSQLFSAIQAMAAAAARYSNGFRPCKPENKAVSSYRELALDNCYSWLAGHYYYY